MTDTTNGPENPNNGTPSSSESGAEASVSTKSTEQPGRQTKRYAIVGVVVCVVLGFLVFKGLGDATMYFRTADEAVAERQALDGKRFRIEGTVVAGTIKSNSTSLEFDIVSKGVTVPVRNEGQPLGVFQENIPVVLEGRFTSNKASNLFESDRIMVKHTEEYEAKYPDRVDGSANATK